jgi:hypothetical protein
MSNPQPHRVLPLGDALRAMLATLRGVLASDLHPRARRLRAALDALGRAERLVRGERARIEGAVLAEARAAAAVTRAEEAARLAAVAARREALAAELAAIGEIERIAAGRGPAAVRAAAGGAG